MYIMVVAVGFCRDVVTKAVILRKLKYNLQSICMQLLRFIKKQVLLSQTVPVIKL
jgi:hypothetical protein